MIYWHFSIQNNRLSIRTPWFGLVWSEWAKSFLSCAIIRGVAIYWKKPNSLHEGDFFYQKSIEFITEYYPYLDYIKDRY